MGHFVSYELLPVIFNMTVTAGVVILAVLLVRFILKKLGAPAVVSYALWAVVLFRLLCPVSVTAPVSLFGVLDAPVVATEGGATTIEYVPKEIVHMENPAVELPVPVVGDAISAVLPQGEEQLRADPLEGPVVILTMVWLAGLLVLILYSIVSYFKLRVRLLGAVQLEGNIRLADHITSPFVMGLFRPKIYLPSNLSEHEREYIILHERHHIRRLDHVVKILAFVALCIHWFNPMVWLAFCLSGKDMEMSCDEAVVKKLGESIRADYSASLLSLSTGRTVIAATPLAFGEGNTKGRIKNLAKWKKPAVWITVVAVILCAAVIVLCATNAKQPVDNTEADQQTEQHEQPPRQFGPDQIYVPERCLYMNSLSSYAAMGGDSGYRYQMGDGGFYMILQDPNTAIPLSETKIPLAEGYGWAKWEQFPWTDKEWEAMFWPEGLWVVDISGYREKKYCPLSQGHCLLQMDDELWLADINEDSKIGTHVWSIYLLVRESTKGVVQWEFDPTPDASVSPFFSMAFPFVFDMEYDEISAVCTERTLMDLDGFEWPNPDGQPGIYSPKADYGMVFPKECAVYWCATDANRVPAERSTVHFTVHKGEQMVCAGTIYIKGHRVEETGNMIYTASLVGTGLFMERNPEGGAVIRIR